MNILNLYLLSLWLFGVPVLCRVFNFRKFCNAVLHDARSKTSSVICDGSSHDQKNLIFDERSIASLSSMEMFNFHNLTFLSTARVSKLTIKNTETVNIPIGLQELSELRLESIGTLTFQDLRNSTNYTKTKIMFLDRIKKLNLIFKKRFLWPVDSLTLNEVDSLDVLLTIFTFEGNHILISKSKINVENSSLVLKFSTMDINKSYLYIHKGGQLNLTASKQIISAHTNTYLMENGSLTLFNCLKASFEDNLFYGLDYKTFKVLQSTDVLFTHSGFFLSAITDILRLRSQNVSFVGNSFDCSYCIRDSDLLGINMSEIGEMNHCYLDCSVSLNQFQDILQKNICEDPYQFIVEGKLCPSKITVIITVCFVMTFLVVFVIVVCIAVRLHHRRKEYCKVSQDTRQGFTMNSSYGRGNEQTPTMPSLNGHFYEEVRTNDTFL